MQTYVVLERWTDQGVRAFAKSPERADDAEQLMNRLGAELVTSYWTMGEYDMCSIIRAPDDRTASALLLADATKGNIRTTTLRAYDRGEMLELVRLLPEDHPARQ